MYLGIKLGTDLETEYGTKLGIGEGLEHRGREDDRQC